jgi:hypothetical protein
MNVQRLHIYMAWYGCQVIFYSRYTSPIFCSVSQTNGQHLMLCNRTKRSYDDQYLTHKTAFEMRQHLLVGHTYLIILHFKNEYGTRTYDTTPLSVMPFHIA